MIYQMSVYSSKQILLILLLFLLLLLMLGISSARRNDYDNIGYFWQITDLHYDPQFNGDRRTGCWKHDGNAMNNVESNTDISNINNNENNNNNYNKLNHNNKRRNNNEINLRKYGDYNCDSTWELIESAAKFMKKWQSDNVEFVLWTGDGLSHATTRYSTDNHPLNEYQLAILQTLTDLLGKTFPAQFVFPALGHDDPPYRKQLGHMWSRWLPTDSMQTFGTGGYYIIERKQLKLQIIVLNTNLMGLSVTNNATMEQWKWLNKVLKKFQDNGETAYLVGHIPPGYNERHRSTNSPPIHGAFTNYNNQKYLSLIRNYSHIIAGQFFGHLHSDTFRIIYDDHDKPVSWIMIAPSITPRKNHLTFTNPALRLYKFNKDSGHVFDYTQFYLDLSKSNPGWTIEYNFTSYYGINDINPTTLNNLVNQFINNESSTTDFFERYYKANNVKILTHPREHCDQNCLLNHYCAIKQIDYSNFESCIIRTALIKSNAHHVNWNPVQVILLAFAFFFLFFYV